MCAGPWPCSLKLREKKNKARFGKRAWERKKPGDVRSLPLLFCSLLLCWHDFPLLFGRRLDLAWAAINCGQPARHPNM